MLTEKSYHYDRLGVYDAVNEDRSGWHLNQFQKGKLVAQQAAPDYAGSTVDDLRQLRLDAESELKRQYDICDTTKPKSIKITNKYYRRDVDVVVANWYDDIVSILNDKGDQRGIQVYNKDLHLRGNPDFPFISIDRINERGNGTNGRLRRMIRFCKNVKADSSYDIQLTSFDINAVCYSIPVAKYSNSSYTGLVRVLRDHLGQIIIDKAFADNIVSVNGREYIFRNSNKTENLQLLYNEITSIAADIPQRSLI